MANKIQDWFGKQSKETDTSYVGVINAMAISTSQLVFYVFLGAWAIHVFVIEQLAMKHEWEIHGIWELNISVPWFRGKAIQVHILLTS